MRRRYFWVLIVTCLIVTLLTLANFLISINKRDELHDSIKNSLTDSQTKNEETIKRLVQEYVAKIEIPPAKDGADGKNGQSIQGPTGPQGRPGKDAEGKDGKDGLPGIPGREIELAIDEAGTILWRYTGDDFWTVIEVVEVL